MQIMAEEKGLKLRLSKDAQLPARLSVDALRVREVLINLLGNAIKFTERGEVSVAVGWNEGSLSISVRDTGVGIPPQSLARAFEPFQRMAGSRTEGTGLGLTITRKLVELMEGKIRASSVPGQGTEFGVHIPAPEAEPAPPQIREEPVERSRLTGKVLVAEDVEHLRSLIEIYLRELGLECRTVSNGLEAVEAALGGDFDVLLLDMEMPVMDGFEAARVLREHGYQKAIVALTAHYLGEEIDRARREGCTEIIGKPVTLARLREVLEPLLAPPGGRPRSSQHPTGAVEARS
jgi:CheY-like chemotaxis protein/anti-sigma regulatory factor (Ser/Thr protein kinase)